jgi:hypothetical protein
LESKIEHKSWYIYQKHGETNSLIIVNPHNNKLVKLYILNYYESKNKSFLIDVEISIFDINEILEYVDEYDFDCSVCKKTETIKYLQDLGCKLEVDYSKDEKYEFYYKICIGYHVISQWSGSDDICIDDIKFKDDVNNKKLQNILVKCGIKTEDLVKAYR